MSKIAVTGHKGQIGSELIKRGYEPLRCDITNLDQVNAEIHRVNPDIIIHCAALTDVGYCEENEREAFAVNVGGTNNLLYDFSGTLIYLSTVHVFNGQKYFDYSERHRPDPLNVYGLTKFAGEAISGYGTCRSVIIRMSRTFSMESLFEVLGTLTYGTLTYEEKPAEFPTFIKRSFNYAPHCAEGISWLAEHIDEFPDLELINIAGTNTLSYYRFWQLVAETYGIDKDKVIPRKHEIDLPPRPFRGGLSTKLAKKIGVPLYSALEGLKAMKDE